MSGKYCLPSGGCQPPGDGDLFFPITPPSSRRKREIWVFDFYSKHSESGGCEPPGSFFTITNTTGGLTPPAQETNTTPPAQENSYLPNLKFLGRSQIFFLERISPAQSLALNLDHLRHLATRRCKGVCLWYSRRKRSAASSQPTTTALSRGYASFGKLFPKPDEGDYDFA